MEAVESLIDGFGCRVEDTLPRMRRWTMHKRPRNFVKTISELEANIRSGKVGYSHARIYLFLKFFTIS